MPGGFIDLREAAKFSFASSYLKADRKTVPRFRGKAEVNFLKLIARLETKSVLETP